MMDKKNEDKNLEISLKLLVKTSFIVFIGLVLSKIFTYAYKIIVARYYGPEIYGIFSLTFMIVGLFSTIFSLGITDGVLRFIPLYREKKENKKINFLLKFSSQFLFIAGIIGSLVLLFSSKFISISIFHNELLIPFLQWSSIALFFMIFFNFLLSILRAYEKISKYSFLLNIFQPIINLIFLLFFIFIGTSNISIIFSYTLSILVTVFFGGIIFLKSIYPSIKDKVTKKIIKKEIISDLIAYSWPIIFLTILSNLIGLTDSLIIGYLMSAKDVGFYNVSTTFANMFNIAPLILMAFFYPLILREFSKNNLKIISELSKQATKWIFILNISLLVPFFLFPGAVINLLFGGNYIIAEMSLKILSIGAFIISLSPVITNLLSMKGKSKILLLNSLPILVLNIFLNILLVPIYGINGAAISSTISLSLFYIILVFESYYFVSIIPLRRKILRVFFVSLIPIIILYYSRNFFPKSIVSLAIQGFLFVLIYLVLMFLTNCLDKNDIMILNAIKTKTLNFKRLHF